MDLRGIFALLTMAGVGLFLAIDWLFLTGAVLAIILYFTSRRSIAGSPLSILAPSAPPLPPQQPVVIQATGASLAHQLFMNLTTEVVKDSMARSHFHEMEKSLSGVKDAISEKVDALERKMEKAAEKHGTKAHAAVHGDHDEDEHA
ncbi:MAG TPA: hypothetical protein VI874_05250 [Candidatus Norongarragalinales archaeon]|nr:hypothetical protein [Candidatus Norongarragalinales archaeon]